MIADAASGSNADTDSQPSLATPPTTPASDAAGWVLLPILGILYVLWQGYMLPHDLNDDALITLTYAKNLIAGHGFVFNGGPESLGTTSPLQTLLLVCAGTLLRGVSLISISIAFGSAAWAATGWLFYQFRDVFRLTRRDAALVSLTVFALGTPFNLGMETWLFLCLIVLTTVLGTRGKLLLAGVSTGFLFLCRGDGALMGLILAAHVLLKGLGERRFPWQELCLLALGFSLVALPWTVYCQVHFGSVLPNTLAAKIVQGQFARRFLPGLLERATEWGTYSPGAPWLCWVFHGLALLGIISIARRHTSFFLIAGWVALHTAAYTLLGVAFYQWYVLPEYFLWQLLVGVGLAAALRGVEARWPGRAGVVVGASLAAATACAMVAGWIAWAFSNPGDYRGHAYREVAAWLNEHAKPEESVGSGDVGYLGYLTDLKIVDFYGLVTPELLDLFKVKGGLGALPRELPAYVIVETNQDGYNAFSSSRRFNANYTCAMTAKSHVRGNSISIYTLHDNATAEPQARVD